MQKNNQKQLVKKWTFSDFQTKMIKPTHQRLLKGGGDFIITEDDVNN